MKKSFSLYSIFSLANRDPKDKLDAVGSLEEFCCTYNPAWRPTSYQRVIGDTITKYVKIAKQTNKRYFIFIVVPPRHGKSALVSGHYPAYHLCQYPTDNVLIWTHSQGLSQDFSYTNREILLENKLPAQIVMGARKGRASLKEWKTTQGGGLHATGIGSRISGKGYEVIICDDLFPDESAALSKAYNMRLKRAWDSSINKRAQKGSIFLFPSVRYGVDDLLGYVQKQRIDAGYGDSIVVLNFTAIAEKNDILGRKEGEALSHLIPLDVLLDIKATTPQHLWEAQYCGRPTHSAGLFYSPENFIRAEESGEFIRWTIEGQQYLANKKNCRFFQFWDTSVKASENSDYSACVTVAYTKIAGKWYLIVYDVWRKQLNTSQLLPALKEQFRRFPFVKKIFIEQAVSGYGLFESALAERFPVAPIRTRQKSKEDRAIPMQSLYLDRSVIHVEKKDGVLNAWLKSFEDELLDFPNGKKDQADSAHYAGGVLVHDLMVSKGNLSEPLYGILQTDEVISPLPSTIQSTSFSDRLFSKSKNYFSME